MLRTSNGLFAGLVLAAAAGVVFWRLSLHPADLLVGPQHNGGNDVTSVFLAFREFQGSVLTQAGAAPIWNPFSLGGIPWLGNPQSALFYPPNWLYGWVSAQRGISWILVAHHWLAGLGTYCVCRRYGFCKSASLVAGISFLGAPYYVAQTGEGHYNQVCLVAYIPWAFLALERLRHGQAWGLTATAAVLALAFFCGHVQELFYLVLLMSAFLAVDVAKCFRPRSRAVGSGELPASTEVRLLGRWLLVGLALAGLTAIELLPMWVYSRQSVRVGGLTLQQVAAGSLSLPSLVQLLDPFAFGGPANYRGPGEYYWEAVCHFGLFPLVFAVLGVCGSYRKYPVARFALLWLLALLFAFGDHAPVFPLLHSLVPGVSLFREPCRALFFCSFFTAVLAGAGFDQMAATACDNRPGRRRGSVLICLLAAIAGTAILAALQWWIVPQAAVVDSPSPAADWLVALQAVSVVRLFVWLLAALLVMLLFALGRPFSRCAMLVGLSVCALELAWHAGEVLRTIPPDSVRRDHPALAFLRQHAGPHRVLVKQELVSDREAWKAGISKVQGYDPVPLGRVALLAAALSPRQDPAMLLAGFADFDLGALRKPLLDAWGVRYAVVAAADGRRFEGWRTVNSGRLRSEFSLRGQVAADLPYTIYENAASMPRAYLVGRAAVLDPSGDLVRQLAGVDPRTHVLMEADVLPSGKRQSFRAARIVRYEAARVTVEATLDLPGYLVLGDTYHPGWTALVDGRATAVLPANLALRAVPLAPGRHTAEFVYVPPGLVPGASLTALTLLSLAGCGFLCWRRRGRLREKAR